MIPVASPTLAAMREIIFHSKYFGVVAFGMR